MNNEDGNTGTYHLCKGELERHRYIHGFWENGYAKESRLKNGWTVWG